MALSELQRKQFEEEGYLVIPSFFSSEAADELKAEADRLVSEFDMTKHPKTIFRTKHDDKDKSVSSSSSSSSSSKHAMIAGGATQASEEEDYFLSSADDIHFFFEDKAFDDNGNLTVDKSRAINKIGHYLHVLNPLFAKFSRSDSIKQLATSIGFLAPIVLQSMVICKQPQIGGEVTKHRDSTFLATVPSTAVGLWFALEDCTLSNGCLCFAPKTHKDGASDKRLIRMGRIGDSINNVSLNGDIPSSCATLTGPINKGVALDFIGADRIEYPDDAFVATEVKKGSVIVIHGDVVHRSSENTSPKSRYIYTFHMIEAHGTTYPATNWLQSSKPFPHLLTKEEETANISRHSSQQS